MIKKYQKAGYKKNISAYVNKYNFISKSIPDDIIPKKGECIDFITTRKVNTMIFIYKIQALGKIKEIYLSTYRIGRRAAEQIKLLNVPVKLLLSDNYKTLVRGDDYVGQLGLDYKLQNVHAKVTLIKQGINWFVITGSGNFSENARQEQYTIRNDKKIYNFYKSWMEESWVQDDR